MYLIHNFCGIINSTKKIDKIKSQDTPNNFQY